MSMFNHRATLTSRPQSILVQGPLSFLLESSDQYLDLLRIRQVQREQKLQSQEFLAPDVFRNIVDSAGVLSEMW